MNKPRKLGKGLSNLIPTQSAEESKDGSIQFVDINAIDANPYQPRMDFDDDEIAGLAESIEKQGLLQPVVLRKAGSRYQIISGERRFRAFRRLRRDSVPCIVKMKVSDNEMLELALVENIQREQLNEIEKAIAYQKLIQQCGYTHDQLSKQVGKSRTAVTNTLRLLNLPDEIQQMVRKNEITMGHARAILSLDDAESQLEAAKRIVESKLTVRDAERIARPGAAPDAPSGADSGQDADQRKPSSRKPKTDKPQDPNITHHLEQLQYKFGTPVRLKETGDNKGRVEIEYFNENDLVRVFDLLLGIN
jgi:ParB family chromosome partitioning protein